MTHPDAEPGRTQKKVDTEKRQKIKSSTRAPSDHKGGTVPKRTSPESHIRVRFSLLLCDLDYMWNYYRCRGPQIFKLHLELYHKCDLKHKPFVPLHMISINPFSYLNPVLCSVSAGLLLHSTFLMCELFDIFRVFNCLFLNTSKTNYFLICS